MSTRTINLTDALHAYLLARGVREPDVLRELREETAALPMAVMQISPEQGQFMRLLVGLIGAQRILEIGTFTGYSALCMASALPEGGRLITCDIDVEYPSFARRYWSQAGLSDKIESRIGEGVTLLDELIADGMAGSFDFVFIDADKTNLEAYYEKSLVLVRAGGLIAVDNTLWSGKVADPLVTDKATKAIRGFNALVSDDARVELSLVPIGDGLTLLRKR